MAINEIPQPGLTSTPTQRDKEILFSTGGLLQKGGTLAEDATAGPNSDGVLPSGTVLAELADGTYVQFGGGASAPANEVQTITIDATGGTFTVTVLGKTTGAIAWNASAAVVKAAIVEAIPDATNDDFTVTKASLVYTVTFKGQYAAKNHPAMTTGAGSLTGGAGTAVVATATAGTPGTEDGTEKATCVLRSAVDVSAGDMPGTLIFAGRLKLDQLVGWTDDAANDLNATVNANRNFVKF